MDDSSGGIQVDREVIKVNDYYLAQAYNLEVDFTQLDSTQKELRKYYERFHDLEKIQQPTALMEVLAEYKVAQNYHPVNALSIPTSMCCGRRCVLYFNP
jgi:prefoldin subunit 5